MAGISAKLEWERFCDFSSGNNQYKGMNIVYLGEEKANSNIYGNN